MTGTRQLIELSTCITIDRTVALDTATKGAHLKEAAVREVPEAYRLERKS